MGIGRFAFTPLMPLMLEEGLLDIAAASWLASANYLGYLIGALLCTFQPALWARWSWPMLASSTMVRAGLTLTCALTAAMAIDVAFAWPWLRFVTGITTAIGFVYTSTWCLAHLARMQRPTAGGIIYMGPGIGITCSGLLASVMVQLAWPASWGWIAFALLALLITLVLWPVFRNDDGLHAPTATHAAATSAGGTTTEKAMLVFAYGLAGFGHCLG